MYTAEIAAIRFGYGLSPRRQPANAHDILAALLAGDRTARRYPMLDPDAGAALAQSYIQTRRQANRSGSASDIDAHEAAKQAVAQSGPDAFRIALARALDSHAPFLERLTAFWADHFTARPKSNVAVAYVQGYLDQVIRGHATGRFADLLKAVATYPLMLLYLDQLASVGPNSRAGRAQGRGLNENLAREMLELHTLGVGARYGQEDVRELAELLTGITYSPSRGLVFRRDMAEPGAEHVLGRRYGGGDPSLDDIYRFFEDVSVHPDTARHLARKLATHFVSDQPDAGLVATLEATWLSSGGDLALVCAALLQHPAAWDPQLHKVKQPFDFLASALNALGVTGQAVAGYSRSRMRQVLGLAMLTMGQRFMSPPGPDGWPEEGAAWITPQGLATRIRWAATAPGKLVDPMPDPRDFVVTALGGLAPSRLSFAATAAETRAEGVALVLASPSFNRR